MIVFSNTDVAYNQHLSLSYGMYNPPTKTYTMGVYMQM